MVVDITILYMKANCKIFIDDQFCQFALANFLIGYSVKAFACDTQLSPVLAPSELKLRLLQMAGEVRIFYSTRISAG